MGLFGGKKEKETCSICGEELSFLNKVKVYDGAICGACREKCAPLATSFTSKTIAEIQAHMKDYESNEPRYQSFVPTDAVGDYLKVDRRAQTWCCPCLHNFRKKAPQMFDFSDVLDYELVEDGETITKGGLGRAVAGGVLFGGVGAIVGGVTGGKKSKSVCNKLSVNINLRNDFVSRVEIPLIDNETKKSSFVYKATKDAAQKIISLLAVMVDTQKAAPQVAPQVAPLSDADELMKFKQLLDAGVITQEEFDAKKKQLLGL